MVASHQTELTQIYPQPGQVKHDPLEIWQTVLTCLSQSISQLNNSINNSYKIEALGITNQRETTIVWNKHTGIPYHNAIVWNDTRTSSLCDNFSKLPTHITSHLGKDRLRYKTGLPITTYFSAVKLFYLLETVVGLREDAEKGDALFGTVDCWLIWKLTNGHIHATDVTNASRTLLFNIHTLSWDQELLDFFHIPLAMLPTIHSSSEVYGHIAFDIPTLTTTTAEATTTTAITAAVGATAPAIDSGNDKSDTTYTQVNKKYKHKKGKKTSTSTSSTDTQPEAKSELKSVIPAVATTTVADDGVVGWSSELWQVKLDGVPIAGVLGKDLFTSV